jgi:hypothetical protein
VTLSPRALIGVAPALVVLVGSFALSRQYMREVKRAESEVVVRYGGEVLVPLSAEDQERLHRVALKLETVDDLMDRRITLAEAVEWFEALDATPEALSNIRASLSGNTDAERTLNQVLSFARVRASQQPKRYNAGLARLEAEARSPAAPTSLPN